MTENQIRWISGKASYNVSVERICPGRHIRSDQWRPEWNRDYLNNNNNRNYYDFISDYECFFSYPVDAMPPVELWEELQDRKRKGTPVIISEVAHYTSLNAANAIVHTGGFLGKPKKINEEGDERNAIYAAFSWWSPVFTASDAFQVRDHLGAVMRPFLADGETADFLKKQFATSDTCSSYRSEYFFRYGIDELLLEYQTCCRSEIEFRILGTFAYTTEVMRAVLVCSRANGEDRFSAYPRVVTPAENAENTAVTLDENGTWTWRPEATGTEITRLQGRPIYPKYRRYDHVAFAFHIPEDWHLMEVRQLRAHLHRKN